MYLNDLYMYIRDNMGLGRKMMPEIKSWMDDKLKEHTFFNVRFDDDETKRLEVKSKLLKDLELVTTRVRNNSDGSEWDDELYYSTNDKLYYKVEYAPGFTTFMQYGLSDYQKLSFWFPNINVDAFMERMEVLRNVKLYKHCIYEQCIDFFKDAKVVEMKRPFQVRFWGDSVADETKIDERFSLGIQGGYIRNQKEKLRESFIEYLKQHYDVLYTFNPDVIVIYDADKNLIISIYESFNGYLEMGFRFFISSNSVVQNLKSVTSVEDEEKFVADNREIFKSGYGLISKYLESYCQELNDTLYTDQTEAVSAAYALEKELRK